MLQEEIIRYIALLKDKFDLQVSVHGPAVKTGDFVGCGIHANPYCMFIKRDARLWRKCRCQQARIINAKTDLTCGTCFAGVFEYVIPIQRAGKVQAFISISGYRSDARGAKQLRILSHAYGLDLCALQKAYAAYLVPKPDAPPASALFAPLIAMLEQYMAARGNAVQNTRDSDYVYAHALAYIHQHYTERITLEDICTFCHCSKSYISHMFKKRSGSSMRQYIAALRLADAKKMLETGTVLVKAAAEAVGYAEPYYFSNAFKKQYHIPPSSVTNSKYRKEDDE